MTLKKWIQVVLIASSVFTLAACSSKHKMAQDDMAINDANAAYSDAGDAQSSGLGEDSQPNGEATSHRLANGRIYHFDFNSSNVREEDVPAIAHHATRLASQPSKRVIVQGHTDPRGSREYNIGLGERRANAVSQVLTQNGVSRSQIRIVSYGAEKLASPGRSEADYQEDRRAVLVDTER